LCLIIGVSNEFRVLESVYLRLNWELS
jgi:hypothetical protein